MATKTTSPKLTPDMLDVIRDDVKAAIASVIKKHNLENVRIVQPAYSPNGAFSFKIEGNVAGGLSKEAALYESARQQISDLPALHSTFTHKGTEYKIIGCNTTASKITVTRESDGKEYLFGLQSLLQILAGQAAKK